MKVEILRAFNDIKTGETYQVGSVVDFTKTRLQELVKNFKKNDYNADDFVKLTETEVKEETKEEVKVDETTTED